jgi:beta-galactosidase
MMRFGVCWYPEQWPRERWATDIGMMADLGLDLVRVGEFAWARLEPEPGSFDWEWLDTVVEMVGEAGMGVVLGTPTATPPVWLMRAHPDIMITDQRGARVPYGSRRHTCTTSATYRRESLRITDALVERYGASPSIAGWQVDNEPGNHDSARCWCGECEAAFSAWLQDRFGTIDALNEAWGTVFWSQTYPDFESVRIPRDTMTSQHPALRLTHRKFASDQSVDFLRVQFDRIRAGVPAGVPITTNLYCEDLNVDARAVARLGGVASMDNYPHGVSTPFDTAYLLDLHATASGLDGQAWVMEQQVGPVNWTDENPQVAHGQARLWMWQAALHGYDASLVFRWRAARYGQEQYHTGLLRHDGTPERAFEEIRSTIVEIKRAALPKPKPRVAIIHSYKDAWAIEINPHRRGLTHRVLLFEAYRAARNLGLDVAIIDSTDDLAAFEIVLAPAMQISTPERIAAIERALDAGTEVILGARSFVIDRENAWSDSPLPAGLSDRLGARVIEPTSQNLQVTIEPWGTPAGIWTDVLEVESAEIVARYGGATYLDGSPAVVTSRGLTYAGFTNRESWQALLADRTGLNPIGGNIERFHRGDALWTIDHDTRLVTKSE